MIIAFIVITCIILGCIEWGKESRKAIKDKYNRDKIGRFTFKPVEFYGDMRARLGAK